MNHAEKFTCLIVDDDAGFVSMLAKTVKQEGGEASECAD